MDGGGAADGDGAAEDGLGAVVDGPGVGAALHRALPRLVTDGVGQAAEGFGQGATPEGSSQGVAEDGDGAASAGGSGSATAGSGQGSAVVGGSGQGSPVAGGSAAGVARGSGQGTARLSSAAPSGQGAAQLASAKWACPEGMDPNSSYFLKIKLFGNPKKARNKDIRCFGFEKVIDCDLTNYKDLVESIVEQYPPRYLEVAHVQYYDDALKTCPEVKSNQDLMVMFEKHSETKVLHMIIAYCDPSETYEPITEWESDVHSEPNNNIEHDDDTYLRNPRPENEHVGVDEENMYEVDEPMPLDVILCPTPNKEKDKDYIFEDDIEDDEVEESEVEEDEELHEAEHTPHVEYDKLDPPMTEGFKYPSMKEFKLALSQHAIKHEFEYNTEYSTPHRFRGYCSRRDADNCPWRIHASTTEDKCTVMVKKNPCGHDCSSTRRKKKMKNATKYWICDKVKDWLIEDATLGAKALRKKIKEHHKVDIHYKRVYMAGRPQTERHKGCGEKKRKSGQHLCPICKEYGHHWHKCKKGNKDDIAALMEVREPPKKRRKATKSAESSIVPRGDEAPAAAMYFPPSQNLETTTKKKGKHNQTLKTTNKKNAKGGKRATRKMELAKKDENSPMVPFDSPAMGTRSKKTYPASPAMSTRSKRRLSL